MLVVIFTNLVSTFGLLTIREKWELTEDSEITLPLCRGN